MVSGNHQSNLEGLLADDVYLEEQDEPSMNKTPEMKRRRLSLGSFKVAFSYSLTGGLNNSFSDQILWALERFENALRFNEDEFLSLDGTPHLVKIVPQDDQSNYTKMLDFYRDQLDAGVKIVIGPSVYSWNADVVALASQYNVIVVVWASRLWAYNLGYGYKLNAGYTQLYATKEDVPYKEPHRMVVRATDFTNKILNQEWIQYGVDSTETERIYNGLSTFWSEMEPLTIMHWCDNTSRWHIRLRSIDDPDTPHSPEPCPSIARSPRVAGSLLDFFDLQIMNEFWEEWRLDIETDTFGWTQSEAQLKVIKGPESQHERLLQSEGDGTNSKISAQHDFGRSLFDLSDFEEALYNVWRQDASNKLQKYTDELIAETTADGVVLPAFSEDRAIHEASNGRTIFMNYDPSESLHDAIQLIYNKAVSFRSQARRLSTNTTVAVLLVDASIDSYKGHCGVAAQQAKDAGFDQVLTLPFDAIDTINGYRELQLLTGADDTQNVDMAILCGETDFVKGLLIRMKAFGFSPRSILCSKRGILEELLSGFASYDALDVMDSVAWPPPLLTRPDTLYTNTAKFTRQFLNKAKQAPQIQALQITAITAVISKLLQKLPGWVTSGDVDIKHVITQIKEVDSVLGKLEFRSNGMRKPFPGQFSIRQVFAIPAPTGVTGEELLRRLEQGHIKFVLNDPEFQATQDLGPIQAFYQRQPPEELAKILNAEFFSTMTFEARHWSSKARSVYPCPLGSQLSGGKCLMCIQGRALSVALVCEQCGYNGGSYDYADALGLSACRPMPKGAIFEGEANTPIAAPGYYRINTKRDAVPRTSMTPWSNETELEVGFGVGSIPEDPPFVFPHCLQPIELCLGNNTCRGFNTGTLCGQCLKGSSRWGRGPNNRECFECPSMAVSWIRVVVIISVWVIFFFCFLALADVDVVGASSLRTLALKQLIHYWHMFSITYELVGGNKVFYITDVLYRPYEFMAWDCIDQRDDRNTLEHRIDEMKSMWFMPLIHYGSGFILIVFVNLIRFIVKEIQTLNELGVRRRRWNVLAATCNGIFTWIFLMYPTGLRSSMGETKCIRTNVAGLYLIKNELDFECNSKEVEEIFGTVPALMIIFYFIVPLILPALYMFWFRKYDYNDITTRRRFSVLICGYRPEHFFVEIVLLLRSGCMVYCAAMKLQGLGILFCALVIIASLLLTIGGESPVPAHSASTYVDGEVWVHLAILMNLARIEQWDGLQGLHHIIDTKSGSTDPESAFTDNEAHTVFHIQGIGLDTVWLVFQAIAVFKLLSTILLGNGEIRVWRPSWLASKLGRRMGLVDLVVDRSADGSAKLEIDGLDDYSKHMLALCMRDVVRATFDGRTAERVPGNKTRTTMVLDCVMECVERALGARRAAEEEFAEQQSMRAFGNGGMSSKFRGSIMNGKLHEDHEFTKDNFLDQDCWLIDENYPSMELFEVADTLNKELGMNIVGDTKMQSFHNIIAGLYAQVTDGSTDTGNAFVNCDGGEYVHCHGEVLCASVPALIPDLSVGPVDASTFALAVVEKAVDFIYFGRVSVKKEMLQPMYDLGSEWRYNILRDVALRNLPEKKTRITIREVSLCVPSVEYDIVSRFLPLHVQHSYIKSQEYQETLNLGVEPEGDENGEAEQVEEAVKATPITPRTAQKHMLLNENEAFPSVVRTYNLGERVFHVCVSRDGLKLAACSRTKASEGQDCDSQIKIYYCDTGTFISSLSAANTVNWAEFSPNSLYIALACKDGMVQVFMVDSGSLVLELKAFKESEAISAAVREAHEKEIDDLDEEPFSSCLNEGPSEFMIKEGAFTCGFSPDGNLIITGGSDGKVKIFDAHMEFSAPACEIKHAAKVEACSISPDGTKVLAACEDGCLSVYSVVFKPSPDRENIKGLVSIFGASRLQGLKQKWLSKARSGKSSTTDLSTDTPQNTRSSWTTLFSHNSAVGSEISKRSFSRKGRQFAVSAEIHDREVFQTLYEDVAPEEDPAWGSSHEVDGFDSNEAIKFVVKEMLADGTEAEVASAWLTPSAWFPQGFNGSLPLIGLQNDDAMLQVQLAIISTDFESFGEATFLFKHQHNGMICNACFNLDGTQILTSCLDNRARIIDVESQTLLHKIEHTGDVLCADFSPGNNRLVTACTEEGIAKIKLFDSSTGGLLKTIIFQCRYAYSVRFDTTGDYLLVGCSDGTAVWIKAMTSSVKESLLKNLRLRADRDAADAIEIIKKDQARRIHLDRFKTLSNLIKGLHVKYRQFEAAKNNDRSAEALNTQELRDNLLACMMAIDREAFNECPKCSRVFDPPDPSNGECPYCKVPVILKEPKGHIGKTVKITDAGHAYIDDGHGWVPLEEHHLIGIINKLEYAMNIQDPDAARELEDNIVLAIEQRGPRAKAKAKVKHKDPNQHQFGLEQEDEESEKPKEEADHEEVREIDYAVGQTATRLTQVQDLDVLRRIEDSQNPRHQRRFSHASSQVGDVPPTGDETKALISKSKAQRRKSQVDYDKELKAKDQEAERKRGEERHRRAVADNKEDDSAFAEGDDAPKRFGTMQWMSVLRNAQDQKEDREE